MKVFLYILCSHQKPEVPAQQDTNQDTFVFGPAGPWQSLWFYWINFKIDIESELQHICWISLKLLQVETVWNPCVYDIRQMLKINHCWSHLLPSIWLIWFASIEDRSCRIRYAEYSKRHDGTCQGSFFHDPPTACGNMCIDYTPWQKWGCLTNLSSLICPIA